MNGMARNFKKSSLAADEEKEDVMLKKIVAVGLCVMVLATSALAVAETVYITPNGSKYHKEDCRFIKNKDAQKIEKSEAVAAGYEPCSRCSKEDLSAVQSENKNQDVSQSQKIKVKNKS
jgi:hypothetical protein